MKLEKLFGIFLESEKYELEVRFGTKIYITRTHFDNVVNKLKSLGFKSSNISGQYELRIMNEFRDAKSGKKKISNVRGEISYLPNIQQYCKTNIPDKIVFNRKQWVFQGNKKIESVEQPDFNFRVNLKSEEILAEDHHLVKITRADWKENKKIFRFLKRFTFIHNDLALKVDCSIVKMSRRRNGRLIPERTIQESNVFNNREIYEIEIEMTRGATKNEGIVHMKKAIKYVLSGLQNTNFPISYIEMDNEYDNYLTLIHGKKVGKDHKKHPTDFLGPSSISLEIDHIMEKSNINIRNNYAVTDKADGARKLLFISKSGKIFMIDTNMNFQFTGCVSMNNHNTIIDGEHVLHNKKGEYVNKYLCFDIYYKKGENVTIYPLVYADGMHYSSPKIDKNKFRLRELNALLGELDVKSVLEGKRLPLDIQMKKFRSSKNIFNECNVILSKEEDGLFEYETDGLIFTPIDKSVGSDILGEQLEPRKKTWFRSFKWKPKEYNTIDFLVTTKKTDDGFDFIGNIFESGSDMESVESITKYKILVLRVGYDEVKHGFMNPFEDVVQNKIPKKVSRKDRYTPRPFQPPGDPKAYICYCKIKEDSNGDSQLFIEDKSDIFEDGTIVEFKYDPSKKTCWKWIPIRVRHDKTSEYRKGLKNYGNAYHVALSVWRSIHNPVTKDMITRGKDIPDQLSDTEVYYNSSNDTRTKALRDFHNRCVKRTLIETVCKKDDTLIDLAVGKGGDLHKWQGAELKFVFGMDISRDNIENRKDGVCARYLHMKMKNPKTMDALFIQGNSLKHVRSGKACFSDKGKDITKAVFGEGVKDVKKIGENAFKHYGIGIHGFDVVSCQFAIHYFFETDKSLNGFLKNVAECCKKGGYFIGTSYDGKKIFQELKDCEKGESISGYTDDHKIWEIIKQYDDEEMQNTGLAIDVYQESINAYWREYLVNYDFLTEKFVEYGFTPASDVDIAAIGNFNLIYDTIDDMNNIGQSKNMTDNEKKISFLNKYFIYKKLNV